MDQACSSMITGTRYHVDCRDKFMTPHAVKAVAAKSAQSDVEDSVFQTVEEVIKSDISRIWTSVEIHYVYLKPC